VRFDDAIGELWHLGVIAFAFLLGSKVPLDRLWTGLAWGCAVSSVVAIVQWIGGQDWQPLPTADWGKPAGLFFNNAVAGAVAAVVIVAKRDSPEWILALPLLALSQSRGAWLALIGTTLACWFVDLRWRGRLGLVIAAAPFAAWAWFSLHTDTDQIRWLTWESTVSRLSFFGHGPGAMMSAYANIHGQFFHLEHAHNDYLTLLYSYGIGSAPLFLLMGWLATRTDHLEWPAFICCCILALYFWPLESPVPAFAFALAAGRMCADSPLAWSDIRYRGLGLLARREARPALASAAGRGFVPIRLEPEG
jgi:hypothetical protein